MRYLYLSLAVLLTVHVATGQQVITLDDCFKSYRFYPQSGPDFRLMKSGRHYSVQQAKSLSRYDLLTQKEDSVLVKKGEINLAFDEYFFSKDEQVLLLRSETTPVYRHSVLANYHVFDLRTRKLIPVNQGAKAQQLVQRSTVRFGIFHSVPRDNLRSTKSTYYFSYSTSNNFTLDYVRIAVPNAT